MRDGFLEKRADPGDRRSSLFLPTDRTLDLIPLLFAAMAWSARHEPTAEIPAGILEAYRADPLGTTAMLVSDIRQIQEGLTV